MRSSTSELELVFPSPILCWLARHQSLCFASLRGLLNFTIVVLGLVHVGCPLVGSLGQALAAGGQSALLQLAPVNERYQLWLHRAPSETWRFARWLAVGSLYLLIMKAAGAAAGIRPPTLGKGSLDLFGTIALSTVQYPWVTAIAHVRVRGQTGRGRQRRRACFVADAHTLAISVLCVGASALSSVGADIGRAALVVIGVTGLCYRASLKVR